MSRILITGGSRGIGLALVRAFKSAGHDVCAMSTKLDGARQGNPDLAVAADVTDKYAVGRCVEQAVAAFGGLDVVINNAGIAGENRVSEDDDDLWYRIVDVNLHGTYLVTRACVPHLTDGKGAIINIASVLGLVGVSDQTAYCASKHAVVGFTRALAKNLAPRRITVNAICPGWVDTDMAEQRALEIGTTTTQLTEEIPLGRMASGDDVAKLALFLASDHARMMTGTAIPVDGGSLA